jgi:hypothetical protein
VVFDLEHDVRERFPLSKTNIARRVAIRQALEVLAQEPCASLDPGGISNQCVRSVPMRCEHNPEGSAPWPPEEFHAWEQKPIKCRSGEIKDKEKTAVA